MRNYWILVFVFVNPCLCCELKINTTYARDYERYIRVTSQKGVEFGNFGEKPYPKLACEQQTNFQSSLLFLLFRRREATAGNTSAVRRLTEKVIKKNKMIYRIVLVKGAFSQGHCCFRFILCWSHFLMTLIYPRTKCSCRVMKKMPNKFHQAALTIITFFGDFCNIALKSDKAGTTFSSFNRCASLPSVTTHNRKQFQCLNMN